MTDEPGARAPLKNLSQTCLGFSQTSRSAVASKAITFVPWLSSHLSVYRASILAINPATSVGGRLSNMVRTCGLPVSPCCS